uniref:Uncharacterized protein n=1 Tax=Anguilla anguilla TaxID=7936 RepID=A0A0E9PV85_ANGAN
MPHTYTAFRSLVDRVFFFPSQRNKVLVEYSFLRRLKEQTCLTRHRY